MLAIAYIFFLHFFQNWGLAIRRVRLDDEGTYTCQTSSHPPQYLLTVLHTVGN